MSNIGTKEMFVILICGQIMRGCACWFCDHANGQFNFIFLKEVFVFILTILLCVACVCLLDGKLYCGLTFKTYIIDKAR